MQEVDTSRLGAAPFLTRGWSEPTATVWRTNKADRQIRADTAWLHAQCMSRNNLYTVQNSDAPCSRSTTLTDRCLDLHHSCPTVYNPIPIRVSGFPRFTSPQLDLIAELGMHAFRRCRPATGTARGESNADGPVCSCLSAGMGCTFTCQSSKGSPQPPPSSVAPTPSPTTRRGRLRVLLSTAADKLV